ncbi:MAG: EamA family transporter [Desulfobacteraceae bacterium]|nr:EamA family transporter [Desulfobacteraceae bacterium]
MKTVPFLLVMISVVTHAYWNFLAKRAENKDLFMGLSKIAEAVIFGVPFLAVLACKGFDTGSWYFVIIASLFVFLNYFFLTSAYKHIDLSVAYPISRSSTLFLPFIAFYFIGETIDPVGITSLVFVTLGVFVIHFDTIKDEGITGFFKLFRNPGIIFALLAAFTVASYTVWDKVAISHIYPFLYFYAYTFLVAVFYAILTYMKFSRNDVREEWQNNWLSIVQVAFFNTFTYVLILIALGISKATYVGTLRQLSLVIGVFLGWKFLNESISFFRVTGVILLVVGGGLTLFAG